jgi:co-chaperonin GroES (HSP10)
MQLKAIKNHIIFQFVDEVDSKGRFVETTKWGFQIPGHFDNSAKTPRWADVVKVGPECEGVKAGQQILINALKWTPSFKFNDNRMWRTDEEQVAAVRTSPNAALKPLRDVIVFRRHDDIVNQGKHGLLVVGETVVDTPKGTVTALGPGCAIELKNAVIYYSEENFFNKFEHKEEQLRYIDEPSVLVYEPA